MSFVQYYKLRKETAETASKALDRVIKPNQVKVARYKNETYTYLSGLTEDEVRKYVSYLRYGETKSVVNGFKATPVEQMTVRFHNETGMEGGVMMSLLQKGKI